MPYYKRRGFLIAAGVVGVLLLLIVIAAIAGTNKKTVATSTTTSSTVATTAPATTATPTTAPRPATTVATVPPTTKAPVPPTVATTPQPQTVFSTTGSGIRTTQKFNVPTADWDLQWSYNCASFGGRGNFQIYITGGAGTDAGVNQLGASGAEVEHYHDGPATYYLEMNSECTWAVKVVTAP